MSFGKKVKELRKKAGYNQSELADLLGVTLKTISNYETKDLRPRKMETYEKLAHILGVSVNTLLTEEEYFIKEAEVAYGLKGSKDAQHLVDSMAGLFAGGELPEEDKDALFEAVQEAYWAAKLANKKYQSK